MRNALVALALPLALVSAPVEAAAPDPEPMLRAFLAPGADTAALSRKLQPRPTDYDAVFKPGLAARARSAYEAAWAAGKMVVAPKPGQTELRLFRATTEELAARKGPAKDFPGGWLAPALTRELKPGVTWYRWKFVKRGDTLGMAYDGLTWVNGHWAVFPKAWRLLED